MSYARARAKKHYRAVQKQIENSPSKSILIPKKNKNKLIGIGVCILILAFLKGMLIGYLCGRNDK